MSPLSHLQTFAVMTSLTLSVDWQTAIVWFAFHAHIRTCCHGSCEKWPNPQGDKVVWRMLFYCSAMRSNVHQQPVWRKDMDDLIVLTISLPDKLFILRPRKTHRPTLVCSLCLLMNGRIFGLGKTVCWVHHNGASQQICSQREEQEADNRCLFVFCFLVCFEL